jgi:hypothetical protein
VTDEHAFVEAIAFERGILQHDLNKAIASAARHVRMSNRVSTADLLRIAELSRRLAALDVLEHEVSRQESEDQPW